MTIEIRTNRINGSQDEFYMNLACNTAATKIGTTGENPCVGCLIVKDDVIVAKGVTGANGMPHAEDTALRSAASKANGATMYVTLEPCCHYGKTSPCTDLIIKSGIKKVVIASLDPDKRMQGKSVKILTDHNIKVDLGTCKKEVKSTNLGYFYRKIHKRPFITLKIASTLDGKIACFNGNSRWVTCAKSRQIVRIIRAQNDCILIGANTLKVDNPHLDCRLPDGNSSQIIKAIIDSKGIKLDPKLNIFCNNRVVSIGAKNNFNHKNFNNLVVELDSKGKVNLDSAVKKLAEFGINNLLVEGGSQIFTDFLKKDLVDKIIWFRSNAIAGADGIDAFGNLAMQSPNEFYKFKKISYQKIGQDTVEFFTRSAPLKAEF